MGGSSSAPALNSPDLPGEGAGRSGVRGGDQQVVRGQVSWLGGDWSQRCGRWDPGAGLSPGGAEEPGRAAGGELAGDGGARPEPAAAGSGGKELGAHQATSGDGGRRLSELSASRADQQVPLLPREGRGSVGPSRLRLPSFPSTSRVRPGPAKMTLGSS